MTDIVEEIEQLVRNAYEEGVEDGIEWERKKHSLTPPEWIDSVARVEFLRRRAAYEVMARSGELQDQGVPASPSGCQPTASAAEGASSRSGIPNAGRT